MFPASPPCERQPLSISGLTREGLLGEFRSSAIGRIAPSASLEAYEAETGIPRLLARLKDHFYGRLSLERMHAWPERFLSAITPGADLTMVPYRFAHWLLTDEDCIPRYAGDIQPVVEKIATLYEGVLKATCRITQNGSRLLK